MQRDRARAKRWIRPLVLLPALLVLGVLAWVDLVRRPAPTVAHPASRLPVDRGEALRLAPAFPHLRFDRPVFLTAAPDGSPYLYVVEQRGRIFRIGGSSDTKTKELFLDLSERVGQTGYEEGLLGLAFHPGFASNGRFFVYYTTRTGAPPEGVRGILAEHDTGGDGRGEPDPVRVLLDIAQPTRFHHGGMLAFGPEGFLYASVGDGDVGTNAQDLACLQGAVLRLDVDRHGGEQWPDGLVPADNPFAGVAGARAEVWAYGLRNPWRFSFDRATGDLLLGDVGSEGWEEIDRIVAGGNYGWPGTEGVVRGDPAVTPSAAAREPLVAYDRSEGQAVIGGYVYRGRALPELQGQYVFADFLRGRIWAARADPGAPGETTGSIRTAPGTAVRKLIDSYVNVTSFGEDAAGELYACGINGAIYRLERGAPRPSLPDRLSETGLFSGLEPVAGAIRYEVNVPLWADGAGKDRFLVLPPGGRIGFRADGAWDLPSGTRLVKTFALPPGPGEAGGARRIETRVIRRDPDGWTAVTYAWNEAGDEAHLVAAPRVLDLTDGPDAPADRPPTWLLMTEPQCRSCHTAAAGGVLGLSTRQLNRPGPDGRWQIDAWREAGWFDGPVPAAATLPRFPAPDDGAAPAADRARAYLDANCSFCHRPGTSLEPEFDLRHDAPLAGNLAGRLVLEPIGAGGELAVLAPSRPERSALWLRMARRDERGMPPIATVVADREALAVLSEWIRGLDRY